MLCLTGFFLFDFRGASPADKHGDPHTTAMEALEGFVVGLYSDCFNAIVSLINRYAFPRGIFLGPFLGFF